MFFLRRPTQPAIDRFLRESPELPLSYGPVGLANCDTTPGRDLDEAVVTIGRGRTDFDRAKEALRTWKQFDFGWVELLPAPAPVDVGTVVAVLIRHLSFWSLNGCRVVYHAGGEGRFGVAYGTLTNHAESGEELFEVFLDPQSDEVKYRIRAASAPRAPLARIGWPIARALQERFRRDSAAAMKRAIRASTDLSAVPGGGSAPVARRTLV